MTSSNVTGVADKLVSRLTDLQIIKAPTDACTPLVGLDCYNSLGWGLGGLVVYDDTGCHGFYPTEKYLGFGQQQQHITSNGAKLTFDLGLKHTKWLQNISSLMI